MLDEAQNKILALPSGKERNLWWWPLRRLAFGGWPPGGLARYHAPEVVVVRKLSVAVLVLLAGAFLGSVSVSQTQAPLCCTVEALPPSPPPSIVAEVTRVVDGDTIVVRLKSVPDGFGAALLVGSTERIRYIGVQAPEPREPHGPQATKLNRLLVEGRTVYLELDEDIRDVFGRLLAYVYLDADGYFMVNLALIATPIIGTRAYPGTTRYACLFEAVDAPCGRGRATIPGR